MLKMDKNRHHKRRRSHNCTFGGKIGTQGSEALVLWSETSQRNCNLKSMIYHLNRRQRASGISKCNLQCKTGDLLPK